jgi:hypothetical protein
MDDINRAPGYIESRFVPWGAEHYPIDPVKTSPAYQQLTGAAGWMLGTARELSWFFTIHLNDGKGYARDADANILYSEGEPVEVEILDAEHIRMMHENHYGDIPEFVENQIYKKKAWEQTMFGVGWSTRIYSNRYMSFNWHETNTEHRFDWDAMAAANILPQLYDDGYKGLELSGHAGNLERSTTLMFAVDVGLDDDFDNDIALVLLKNECGGASEEKRDQSLLQPNKFSFYDDVSASGAFPHRTLKQPELVHVMLKRAIGLD